MEKIQVPQMVGTHGLVELVVDLLPANLRRHVAVLLKYRADCVDTDFQALPTQLVANLAWAQAGVRFRVVPGISAVQACAAYAGIPLTDRRHAQALRLVTAHCGGSVDAVDWAALTAGGETLAFYMGVRQAARIQARLIAHGLSAQTPVACIENGSRPQQRVLLGSLGDLAAMLRQHQVASPALLLVGEVCRYASTQHWFGRPAQDFVPASTRHSQQRAA